MQGEATGIHDNAAASAAFTEHSSPRHSAADDEADSHLETTDTEDQEIQSGKKSGNGSGYEVPDPREVEEARMRAQQPSEYAGIRADTLEDLYNIPKKKKNP